MRRLGLKALIRAAYRHFLMFGRRQFRLQCRVGGVEVVELQTLKVL